MKDSGACAHGRRPTLNDPLHHGRRYEMRPSQTNRCSGFVWFLTAALALGGASAAGAQGTTTTNDGDANTAAQSSAAAKPTFEIYGFAMLDMGQNFTQINPNWF